MPFGNLHQEWACPAGPYGSLAHQPPAWVTQDLAAPGGRDLSASRVRGVVGHFQGRVMEWDVVNEAIEPRDGLDRSLRNSQLYRAGGPTYIADCFHAAHEADPAALLVYNEYGLEYHTVEKTGA